MSRTFVVTTEGQNRLGLCELCERYVNDQRFSHIWRVGAPATRCIPIPVLSHLL
jgi:hypothetical protein